ncbi:MAG: PAS domain S-box protein [Methanomicrobiales archaeon]|nr:PAS domain S-box protein [Methanomicrobiales archaeon]
MENLPAAIYIKDEKSRVVFSNRYLNDLIGTSNPVGESCFCHFPEAEAQQMALDDQSVVTKGAFTTLETITDHDGKLRVFSTIKFALPTDSDNSLIGGISLDITQLKKAESAIRESEERFRTLIESSPVAILLARDNRFIYVNKALCRMVGYTTSESILGRSLFEFIAPEYHERVTHYILARSKGEPAEEHYEAVGIRRDGTRFPYEISVTVIQLSDGPVTMAYVNDISARKTAENLLIMSEAKFRRAESIAGIGHWEFHLDTGKVTASEGTIQIYDCMSEPVFLDDVIQRTLPEFRPLFRKNLEDLIADGKPREFEYRMHHLSDQTVRDIRAIAEYNPQTNTAFGVIKDMTRYKKAETALRESEELFRTLVQQSADAIVLIDDDGIIIEWNDAAEKITGIPRSEAIGAVHVDLMVTLMIPQHQNEERISRFRGMMDEALRTGTSEVFFKQIEAQIIRRDGERRIIQQTAFPIKTTKGYRIGSIVRDITGVPPA